VGIVSAVVLALLVAGTLALPGLGRRSHTAELAHTAGLRAGDEVRVAGIGVGEVTAVELAGDRVLATFRVRDVEIGDATTATVRIATLLGRRALELRPGGARPQDGPIPLARTSVPFDLQKVLETGTPVLEELDSAAFAEAVSAMSENLRDNGPRLAQALDGLSRLSDVVVARRDQIAELIRTADAVTSLLDERSGAIFALMGQSDVLLRELLRRRELIRDTLRELAGFTGQLRDLLAENAAELGPLLDRTAELAELLRRNDEAIDQALELLAPAGRYLNNALGNGPYLEVYLPYSLVPDDFLCAAGAVDGCE
jgi:phospholipid/cholesterol/gamma-HCH transport system substrate-binding protein